MLWFIKLIMLKIHLLIWIIMTLKNINVKLNKIKCACKVCLNFDFFSFSYPYFPHSALKKNALLDDIRKGIFALIYRLVFIFISCSLGSKNLQTKSINITRAGDCDFNKHALFFLTCLLIRIESASPRRKIFSHAMILSELENDLWFRNHL
jgi:hypothetical protein